jgi:hypothetical protein
MPRHGPPRNGAALGETRADSAGRNERNIIVTQHPSRVKRHRGAFPDRSFRALQRLGAQAFDTFLNLDGLPLGRWSSR